MLHSIKKLNLQQKLWDVHYLLYPICSLPQGIWDKNPELPNTIWAAERVFRRRQWAEQWEHSMVTKFSALVFLCKIMLLSYPVGVSFHCFTLTIFFDLVPSHILLRTMRSLLSVLIYISKYKSYLLPCIPFTF